MNIDILIPNFEDLGAQRVAINAANGLMAQHQVRVIVNQRKGPFSEYLDAAIEVVCLDELGLKIPKLQVLIRMLVYTFKVVQPDSVSISYAPIMNLTALVAKLFRGNSIIIQEHALLSAALKDHYAHGLVLRLVYRWVFLPAYRYADRFLAISRAIRDDLVDNFNLPRHFFRVIYNPLDTDKIREMAQAPLPEGVWRQRDYLLGVGRLADQKDFSRLIEIFSLVAKTFPQLDLVIVGKGEREQILRELVEYKQLTGRIHFAGFQSNPYTFMANAKAFCLTSLWEGLPQVLAEAMVCGTPVIAHRCPSGPDEMIVHAQTGWLVSYQDNQSFALAIQECLRDSTYAKKIAKQAGVVAMREYSIANYIKQLNDLIHQVRPFKTSCIE
jgi:glycosyltransferase involved in cell wall biosynthesis